MSFTALYEGDSVIHFVPRARVARVATPRARVAIQGTPAAKPLARPVPHRTRHGAVKALIGGIWNALKSAVLWIDQKFREAHYRRIEIYLAQSTDHADLERRLRDLERGNRLNWTDCGSR